MPWEFPSSLAFSRMNSFFRRIQTIEVKVKCGSGHPDLSRESFGKESTSQGPNSWRSLPEKTRWEPHLRVGLPGPPPLGVPCGRACLQVTVREGL